MNIRCSSLPLAVACPASQLPSAVLCESDSDDARLGSAAHDGLARRIKGIKFGAVDLASEWGVDADELAMLLRWAWQFWERFAHLFPQPELEMPVADPVPGHIDLLSVIPDARLVRLLDWKSGRIDADATAQVKGYALGALRALKLESAYAVVVRIRDRQYDVATYTRDELESWWGRTAARLSSEAYSPGPHCRHCPRRIGCPAIGGLIEQAAQSLLATASTPGEMTPDATTLIDLHQRRKLLEKVCEDLGNAIKVCVSALGGSVVTEDGRELAVVSQQRRKINYRPASQILIDTLGQEAVIDLIQVSKGAVEDAVKATAGRGQKGAAVIDLMDRLDKAGALTTQTVERLELRRAPKQIGAEA